MALGKQIKEGLATAKSSFEGAMSASKAAGGESAESVALLQQFYRDNHARMMFFCLMLLLIASISVLFNIFQFLNRPSAKYFAVSPEGKFEMTPLDRPNLSTESLLQWATEAASSSYNYDFVNYREKIQQVRSYFTPQGYQHYIDALKQSRTIDTIIEKKLVVSAVPTGAPVILKEAEIKSSGRWAWQVQMPMLISYQSANEVIKQEIVLTLLIVRVDTLESPKGVGIAQFIVQTG